MKKLFLIEDDPEIRRLVSRVAGEMGFETSFSEALHDGYERIQSSGYDLVIIDAQSLADFPGPGIQIKGEDGAFSGYSVLPVFIKRILGNDLIENFIVIARGGFLGEAEYSIKNGAMDYIQIPVLRNDSDKIEYDFGRFQERLKGCLSRTTSTIRDSRTKQLNLDGLVGTSPKFRDAIGLLADAAGNNFNVLITGEVGTGKKLFAQKIHDNSMRKGTPFNVVDCSSFNQTENGVDGIEKLFEKNNSGEQTPGTIVFDEICYLPISLQGFLLRLIQQNRSENKNTSDVNGTPYRIIASSSINLNTLIANNQFRNDLYFELNTIEIAIPPLKDRVDDIPHIAAYLIYIMQKESGGDESVGMSADFISALTGYNWPGNITELKNALKVAIKNSADSQTLHPAFLPKKVISESTRSLFYKSFPVDDTTMENVLGIINSPGTRLSREDLSGSLGEGTQTDAPQEDLPVEGTETNDTQNDKQPRLCFYQNGDFWEIGNPESPVSFQNIKGHAYIHFLLQYPKKNFNPLVVFNLGKSPSETSPVDENEEESSIGQSIDFDYQIRDPKTQKALTKVIKEFNERLNSGDYDGEEEKLKLEEGIKKYTKNLYRKPPRGSGSQHEKVRTNVQKTIKRALEKIHARIQEIKQYLNESTIKCGDDVRYVPIEGSEPAWILFKEKNIPKPTVIPKK